jgi:acyl dehydratase
MTVRAGDLLPELVVPCVSAEAMRTVAELLQDPNPIHLDARRVRELGLGDRQINQGPTNLAYVLDLLSVWAGASDRIGRVRLRFLGNVYADDRVAAGGLVTAVEEEDGARSVEVEVWLDRDGGDRVAAGTATVVLPG